VATLADQKRMKRMKMMKMVKMMKRRRLPARGEERSPGGPDREQYFNEE
jgi:hypothetical protein